MVGMVFGGGLELCEVFDFDEETLDVFELAGEHWLVMIGVKIK